MDARAKIVKLERGEPVDGISGRSIPVRRCVDAFLQEAETRNVRSSSLRGWRATLRRLEEFTAPAGLEGITLDSLTHFRQSRKGRDGGSAAPGTLRKETETIRQFLRFCADREWIARDPSAKLSKIRGESKPTAPFTDDEVRGLLDACDRLGEGQPTDVTWARKRARSLVLVLLYTGLRIGDAVALRRSSINWETRHITLRVTKTHAPVKLQLKPYVLDELKRLPAEHPVFFFFNGGNLKTCIGRFQSIIQRLGEIAGIHAHAHRFRDTFARGILDTGGDMRTLKELLGHTSLKTTERHYAHFSVSQQRILDSATAALGFGEDIPAALRS